MMKKQMVIGRNGILGGVGKGLGEGEGRKLGKLGTGPAGWFISRTDPRSDLTEFCWIRGRIHNFQVLSSTDPTCRTQNLNIVNTTSGLLVGSVLSSL